MLRQPMPVRARFDLASGREEAFMQLPQRPEFPMTKPPTIAAQLAALPQLPQDHLWALWDEHFPRRPSRVNRRYLEARLAYRLQEIALGGLSPAVRAHLADCGERHCRNLCGSRPGEHSAG